MLEEVRRQTTQLALRLGVIGLVNVQFGLVDNDRLHVIEANPRASRTVPFVSKAIGVPLAKVACRVILGERLAAQDLPREPSGDHVSVKEAVLPFQRLQASDALLGPEMKSTGEVMGIARDFPTAFGKAQAGAGVALPSEGAVFISVCDTDKPAATQLAARMHDLGFRVLATRGTAAAIRKMGTPVEPREQGGRGVAARRRPHPRRRRGPRDQHPHRARGAHGRVGDPPRGDRDRHPVHHDDDRRLGGGTRDRSRARDGPDGALPPGAARHRAGDARPSPPPHEHDRSAGPPSRRPAHPGALRPAALPGDGSEAVGPYVLVAAGTRLARRRSRGSSTC